VVGHGLTLRPCREGTPVGYPSQVPTLFRRKPAVIDSTESEPEAPANRSRNYTPSKRELGVTTPKRTGTNVRRVGAPALDPKEARALARQRRIEAREAMMNGDESALNPRDRGPEKRLVRDVVDSRRNVNILFGILALMVVSLISPAIELIGLPVVIAVVVIDSILLVRRVKSVIAEKMPKSSTKGLAGYAIMRAMSFRRMRIPKPQVKAGQKLD
jgi:Protein of unknown function (DUF3043)